jgi:RNA polymerase sigma-70 factor (ECF subfamily)
MTADITAELFESHRERVRAFFSRRVSPEEIDDLVQEVFARFARSVASQTAISEPVAYLFRIAQHVLVDYFRERPPPATDVECLELEDESFETRVADYWSEAWNRAIAALAPLDQALYLLRYRQGWDYKKIGREFNLDPDKVRTYMTDIVKGLEKKVRR